MEVVAATPNGGGMSPFHNHDVCEWSCVDSLTGVLERARRETDHWTANTNNSRHKYGKVVDCRARSGVDGNLKQEARRQLEVFQSQIPGGRLQVIKTQSVSSSRWTNRLPQESHDLNAFKDLHLSLNPLDVSSQKSKASLGRSNVGKRPPTRQLHHQRNRNAPTTTTSKNHDDTSSSSSITNLHRVPRLCHQIHDSAAKSYIQTSPPSSVELHDKQQSSASVAAVTDHDTNHQLKKNEKNSKLTSRTPSTSSDDSHLVQNQYSLTSNDKEKSTKSIEDLEDLEKLRDWRRTSKLRSFQHTKQNKIVTAVKPTDLPENNGSVRKIREDIEKGRRLNAALRSSNVNLEALDQILLSITTPCLDERKLPTLDKDRRMTERQLSTKSKKNSFVTVDSIKEVRDRLRRTTSPVIDDRTCMNKEAIEHNDEDSFVTEICKMSPITSKVKSYTYGMENAFAKKSTSGTGSLESRLKHLNSHSIAKNEDWYNRRKSYGFEKMHNPHNDNIAKTKTADSSTDSGICRSSEIPSHTPEESSKPNEQYIGDGDEPLFTSSFGRNSYNLERENCKINDIETTTINIPIVSQNAWKLFGKEFIGEGDELKRHSIAVDESKYILKNAEPKFRRTSLAVNASDLHLLDNDAESFLQNRRQKKVEFCKTEVHFTAESGKVNIVETDDKPPSTNNFRKKRRNSGLMLNFEYGRNNGLPMFNFGDDIPINDEGKAEDFGSNKEDILENGVAGLVTVNSKLHEDIEENHRENFEFDLPKSILKNKAAKPKRYILGDDENYLSKNLNDVEVSSANNPWEVRLNPIRSEAATPMWQSTVTVRNTLFSDGKSRDLNSADVCVMRNDGQMTEIQKLLRNLRPVSRTTENSSDFMNGIRIVSPNDPDARPAAWSSSASVSDRIKHVENQQKWMENRGYSTKVNIGNGEATVIEDHPDRSVYNKHPTWPRIDETSQDVVKNEILNRGLVVRISRDATNSKNTVYSKTSPNQNDTSSTTTTKITIDLTSPSSTNEWPKKELNFQSVRVPLRASPSRHDFKSASLILNTIKTERSAANVIQKGRNDLDGEPVKIPEQLEALRRLYEEAAAADSGSETDREVQNLMSRYRDADRIDEECSSVVSGSWRRVGAMKNSTYFKKDVTKSAVTVAVAAVNSQRNDLLHARLEKDLDRMQHVADTKTKRTATGENIVRLETQEHRNHVRQNKNDVNVATSPPSRAAAPHKSFSSCPIENGSKFITNKLSSPALVGKSTLENQTLCDTVEGLVNRSSSSSVRCFAKHDSLERQAKKSSEKILPQKIRGRSPGKEVLRQPKKAEMAYFGLPVSPQTAKKHFKRNSLSEKPDLLQFIENKPETSSNVHIEESLYENVDSVRQKQTATVVATRGKCEFDSSILEELTRAADQILQAVNGYTEEDSEHKKNHNSRKPLDTISETKSWRQQDFKTTNTRPLPNKSNSTKTTKIKPTSSNSSIESVHTDRKKSSKSSERKLSASTLSFESKKVSRKIANDSNATTTTTRANVKARRLQRASSREALLQSHGSSSEDLPVVIEVPLRKPRLIRKNKNANSTTTDNNSLEKKVKSSGSTSNKREDLSVKSKSNTRVPATDLPEIRHKTAVSTIRSTAERSVAREKTEKFKTVESKRKPLQKSDSHGVSSSAAARNEKSKSSSGRGRENSIQSQRASTANVKRCIRQEGLR